MASTNHADAAKDAAKDSTKASGEVTLQGAFDNGNTKLSIETCVQAMDKSLKTKREALHTELALGLAIFTNVGEASKEAKGFLMQVYQQAGFDCGNAYARQYKYVNDRVTMISKLYTMIGQELLVAWIGNKSEAALIKAIEHGLMDTQHFRVFDDVKLAIGMWSNKGKQEDLQQAGDRQDDQRKQEDVVLGKEPGQEKDDELRVDVGRIHLRVPSQTDAATLMKIAAKFMAEARKKAAEEDVKPIRAAEKAIKAVVMH